MPRREPPLAQRSIMKWNRLWRLDAGLLGLSLVGGGCVGEVASDSDVDTQEQELDSTADYQRTVILIRGETQDGQDMFVRGGIDHGVSKSLRGITCTNPDGTPNYACAIPLRHRNLRNATTSPWKTNDGMLDWYGKEAN